MNPDPVCPKRIDPDPVNIRPDPKPWSSPRVVEIGLDKRNTYSYLTPSNDENRTRMT